MTNQVAPYHVRAQKQVRCSCGKIGTIYYSPARNDWLSFDFCYSNDGGWTCGLPGHIQIAVATKRARTSLASEGE